MTQRDSTREIGTGDGFQTDAAAGDLSRGVAGLNRFAFRLYGELATTSRSNLFFSPFSISAALAMTHAGARGQTADEIRKALDLPQGNDYVYAQLGSLWKGVSGEGYLLRTANRLWGQIGEPFLPQFLGITRDLFGAELAAADFATDAKMVRKEINAWVEKIGDQRQGRPLSLGSNSSCGRRGQRGRD
jgi:serpin B